MTDAYGRRSRAFFSAPKRGRWAYAMNRDPVTITGNEIAVGNVRWRVRWPVDQAALVNGHVIVLYDYMAGPKREHFPNLESFTPDGMSEWMAEHPIRTATDSYTSFWVGPDPEFILASSFAGFTCKLAVATGELVEADFTK